MEGIPCSTERSAQLLLALAALFDERSNRDQTGQQQALSWAAFEHAREGLGVLTTLGWSPMDDAADASDAAAVHRADVLSGALLLGAKSLCNVALDGDAAECSAVEAMAQAEGMLQQVRGPAPAALRRPMCRTGGGAARGSGPRAQGKAERERVEV